MSLAIFVETSSKRISFRNAVKTYQEKISSEILILRNGPIGRPGKIQDREFRLR